MHRFAFWSLYRVSIGFLTAFLLILGVKSQALVNCPIVTTLISTCSAFITYGMPNPTPGTPCCDAMVTLNMIASGQITGKRMVCRCLMGLIATYNPNASVVASLAGLCGVSLGFNVGPNTDCNFL